jgi:hypothetical protein
VNSVATLAFLGKEPEIVTGVSPKKKLNKKTDTVLNKIISGFIICLFYCSKK